METLKQIALEAIEAAIEALEEQIQVLKEKHSKIQAADTGGDPVPPDPSHPHP